MLKNALSYLLWANPKSIANSFEQDFYDANASLFRVKTSMYNENRSIFDIIKSCAVLRGLKNRELLNDDYLQFPQEQLSKHSIQHSLQLQIPFFLKDDIKIFVPTYSKEINKIYSSNPSLLKEESYERYLKDENYDIVNPFITYGFELLDSCFTRLIKLQAEKDNIKVFYHYDFETLFFVDNELNLIGELPIFDEKAKFNDYIHLFEVLNIVSFDYLNNDIYKLFEHLKEFKLLSSSLCDDCIYEETKFNKKRSK